MSLHTEENGYKDLPHFLAKHNTKNTKLEVTHTRIGSTELQIYGGAYHIPQNELEVFYELYYDHVFVKKKPEYITERQLCGMDEAVLVVDFDFRYDHSIVTTRPHTQEHIMQMVYLYLEECQKMLVFDGERTFDVFIFEKPDVNILPEKGITKDGIHMLISIQMNHVLQCMLREAVIKRLPEIWSGLPLINDFSAVLDEGISKGTCNWQLYGSRKPGNLAYQLTYHYKVNYRSMTSFHLEEKDIGNFRIKEFLFQFSVQNKENPAFPLHPRILDAYNQRIRKNNNNNNNNNHNNNTSSSSSSAKRKATTSLSARSPKSARSIAAEEEEAEEEPVVVGANFANELMGTKLFQSFVVYGENDVPLLEDIHCRDDLDAAMEAVFARIREIKPAGTVREIFETHLFTQALPEKYFQPGSHVLNRQVAFALKFTDESLFLSWVMLRSNADDFEYDSIPKLYADWTRYFNVSKQGVTRRSIMYWCKQDNADAYRSIKESTLEFYLEQCLESQTEYDFASVIYHMFKDMYVCVSYDKKGIWYVFRSHKWELDKGLTVRGKISVEVYGIFSKLREKYQDEYYQLCNNQNKDNDHQIDILKRKVKTISDILIKLKRSNDKNNILREAAELFYDNDFIRKMDTNKYLLCFTNGVVDFETKTFRDGYPQDYITKCTMIEYHSFLENEQNPKFIAVVEELVDFMQKLFPIPELNTYMYDHLASCLIGVNKNQTFNIYHGSGSNGKSILTDLMSHVLGNYKGIVPITLVTEKRGAIGGTSSELIQLKGIRYAVMQEPSKNLKLNEGIMKELTGGDPMQGRALYAETETFDPQFNLVVCTNNLFDIDSNDEGTWRRIRQINFISKFVEEEDLNNNNENEEEEDKENNVFLKDKSLKDKLPVLAKVFASMLVHRAFETDGIVQDCEYVMEASRKYRISQDFISGFVKEMVDRTNVKTDVIKKRELKNQFDHWFTQEQGGRRRPSGDELYAFMDKKFGPHRKSLWTGVKIRYPSTDGAEIPGQ